MQPGQYALSYSVQEKAKKTTNANANRKMDIVPFPVLLLPCKGKTRQSTQGWAVDVIKSNISGQLHS